MDENEVRMKQQKMYALFAAALLSVGVLISAGDTLGEVSPSVSVLTDT